MGEGSLYIVGTGIQAAGQITIEARAHIEQADKFFYLVAHHTTEFQLHKLNKTAESLLKWYETDKERFTSYMEMVNCILSEVRKGLRVCVAFYGHPGVFAFPGHEAIRQARREGYTAKMLPGISAEDCLFADLGIDPSSAGCQSFEATDFLLFKRQFDPRSSLILWQIGVIGDSTFQGEGYDNTRVKILSAHLQEYYKPDHKAIVYVASYYSVVNFEANVVPIRKLKDAKIDATSTLYVPPIGPSVIDEEMLMRLGISRPNIRQVTVNLNVDTATEQ